MFWNTLPTSISPICRKPTESIYDFLLYASAVFSELPDYAKVILVSTVLAAGNLYWSYKRAKNIAYIESTALLRAQEMVREIDNLAEDNSLMRHLETFNLHLVNEMPQSRLLHWIMAIYNRLQSDGLLGSDKTKIDKVAEFWIKYAILISSDNNAYEQLAGRLINTEHDRVVVITAREHFNLLLNEIRTLNLAGEEMLPFDCSTHPFIKALVTFIDTTKNVMNVEIEVPTNENDNTAYRPA